MFFVRGVLVLRCKVLCSTTIFNMSNVTGTHTGTTSLHSKKDVRKCVTESIVEGCVIHLDMIIFCVHVTFSPMIPTPGSPTGPFGPTGPGSPCYLDKWFHSLLLLLNFTKYNIHNVRNNIYTSHPKYWKKVLYFWTLQTYSSCGT